MTDLEFVKERVHNYYWKDDLNCCTTSLKTLAEYFKISLSQQVLDSAVGMHGAGGYRAQCGLVEGSLMFIGIACKVHGMPKDRIVECCKNFAQGFDEKFGSLSCKLLRPGGFSPDDPPHMCEDVSVQSVFYTLTFVKNLFTF